MIRLSALARTCAVALVATLAACGLPTGAEAPDVTGEWWNEPPGTSLADMRGRVVLLEFWRSW